MTEGVTRARLSLSVPLVAYRGLWDKFAEPGSAGAIRRAYLRDVPCVVRASEDVSMIAECAAIAADPAINRQSLPLLKVDDGDKHAAALPLFLFDRSGWLRCGVYLPVRRAHTIASQHLRPAIATAVPWVLVESTNVIQAHEPKGIVAGSNDDEILTVVMEMASADARCVRVSDFVELDFLDRQREAA